MHLQKNEETMNYDYCRMCEQNQIDLNCYKTNYYLVKEEQMLDHEKCKELLENVLKDFEAKDKKH